MRMRQILQRCWSRHSLAATTALFISTYDIVIQQLLDQQPLNQALQPIIKLFIRQASFFVVPVERWLSLDVMLFDIPLVEYLQSKEFRPRMFQRIRTLETDMVARKMTNFTRDQLTRLYKQFSLAEYCQVRNQDYIRVPTGHTYNGSRCFIVSIQRSSSFAL